jgi:adenine/guanine phosphoribosyltransferase-like PRPP-binding protein
MPDVRERSEIIQAEKRNTMLTEDGKHLYVSYDEYHNLIEKLAIKVHQSGWEFDTILCLARGGMRPGDILSRIFDKPLAIMSTSSYRATSTLPASSPPRRASSPGACCWWTTWPIRARRCTP